MCLSSFINIICFFYFFLLWNILKVNVRKIGIYIYLLFTIIYSILFLINPGTPDKSHFLENNINESLAESRICNICKIVIKPNENIHHCDECNICIIDYDHHCPWTSKCIGKYNYYLFMAFLTLLSLLIFYLIIALFSIPLQ